MSILAIHVFGWLFAPGPMTVLILRNSLLYSRRAGIWTALGIALGNFVHISYSLAAIFLVISISDTALMVVRYLGVGYLAYLGIKTVMSRSTGAYSDADVQQKDISPFAAGKTGFLTNILSPTASLFFASIFASVVSSGFPLWVVLFLWIAMPLNSLLMASLLSVLFSHNKIKSVYTKYERITNVILGGLLLLLALMILLYT